MPEPIKYPGDDYVSKMTHSQVKDMLEQNVRLVEKIQSIEVLIAKKDEALKAFLEYLELVEDPWNKEDDYTEPHCIGKGKQALALTAEKMGEQVEKTEKFIEAFREWNSLVVPGVGPWEVPHTFEHKAELFKRVNETFADMDK